MNILVIALAFVAAGLLVWKLWKPIVKPAKKVVPPNEARIYFFYTNWCGFSKKAMPEWEKLESKLKTRGYYGKTHVTPVRVDADKEKDTASLYEVDAYPTVILETSNGLTPYTKRVTTEGLLDFLRSNLGEEGTSL
jgi:thiol-disulfide isomerase/thioredoxin